MRHLNQVLADVPNPKPGKTALRFRAEGSADWHVRENVSSVAAYINAVGDMGDAQRLPSQWCAGENQEPYGWQIWRNARWEQVTLEDITFQS